MTDAETKRLRTELEALPDYQGWTFTYDYPGYFSYRRGAFAVNFTPDWEDDKTLPIEVQDDAGQLYDEYSRQLPLPRAGRTGRKLFRLVKPTLDAVSKISEPSTPSRQHATKKSAARLNREIKQALGAASTQRNRNSPKSRNSKK